jgi:hypothetical protein
VTPGPAAVAPVFNPTAALSADPPMVGSGALGGPSAAITAAAASPASSGGGGSGPLQALGAAVAVGGLALAGSAVLGGGAMGSTGAGKVAAAQTGTGWAATSGVEMSTGEGGDGPSPD